VRQLVALAIAAVVLSGIGALVLRLLPAGEPERVALPPEPPEEPDVIEKGRFSSRKLPALSAEAPAEWAFEVEKAGKLVARRGGTRLVISTAHLREVVDARLLLQSMADAQTAQGLEVGQPFPDRIGELAAVGAQADGQGRSVSTWMVKRGDHLVSSLMCLSEGTAPAREACRPVIATVRWKTPHSARPAEVVPGPSLPAAHGPATRRQN
jgi:hypothetical protein